MSSYALSQSPSPADPACLADRGLALEKRPAILQEDLVDAGLRGGVETMATPQPAASIENPPVFWRLPAIGKALGRILLSAGIHGDEPAGILAVLQLVAGGLLPRSVEWMIAPCLCPESFLANQRDSPTGIDPNRDFQNPRCPEIQAYRSFLEKVPAPDLLLSLHEDWEYDGAYIYELNNTDRPSLASAILDVLRSTTGLASGNCLDGHKVTARGYIFHANREDEPGRWPEAIYLSRKYFLRSYTVETPSSHPLEERIDAASRAVLAATEAFCNECRDGGTLPASPAE